MVMRENKFARGLIIGGIIGATVGMMNSDQAYKMRRRITRTGRKVWSRGSVLKDAIWDLF